MIIKAEVHIKAPMTFVWRAFSALDQWKDWNMACDSCRFTLGESLAEGACFTFVVKPFIFPVRVEPQVSSCDPAREVVWTGNRFGIHAVHTWRFREDADGVLLESVETFRGPLLVIGNMVGIPKRLHRLTVEMLDQIKRYCETCALIAPSAPSSARTAINFQRL